MDHFKNIYRNQAAAYHALIAAEDADGNLLRALQTITPLAGKRVLDLGSGSGRIPLLLKDLDCEMLAVDLHHAMLAEQAAQAAALHRNWPLLQADLRRLPLVPGWADVAIAGWAIGHFTGWYANWRPEMRAALNEMRRAVKPGGTLIILETLGTGVLEPGPPNTALAAYYAWLENELGFRRQVIATDYNFGSVDLAVKLCGFFFGEELGERIQNNNWSRVPEFTGIWSY